MANALETKLSNAKDIARKFLVEEITEQRVGEYLGFVVEGENVATHKFKCVDKAYVGWNWAVTLAIVDSASEVTVSEILLLPGEGAILASSSVTSRATGRLLPPAYRTKWDNRAGSNKADGT